VTPATDGPPPSAGGTSLRPGYGARVTARAAVSLASLILLVASGLAWAAYKNFTSTVPHGDPVPALGAGQQDLDGKAIDILLTGNDSRAGASAAELRALSTTTDGGSVNTDTMMLLHVPADGSRATIVSFPRDSWVDIPGHGKGKINSAFGIGYTEAKNARKTEIQAESAGLIMTIKTISALTGLHIDHYVQVNLLGFYRISNAIGGVPVCLNAAQNATTDSDAFGKGYSGINLPKGTSVIKGSQALAFVRQRHGLPRGDLDRIVRQQYFLASAFHKVESAGVLLNPFKLHDLLGAVGSSLLTDPTLNMLSLGRTFADMSAGNISYKTIPNNGPQLIYPDGVTTSIVEVNGAAIPSFVRGLDGKADSALAKARAAEPASVTVDVLNGTQTVGLAGRNADQLTTLGFHINTVDSANSTVETTTVQYPDGMEAQAKAVSAVVKGAKLVPTPSVQRVTLILGTDGLQVTGLAAGNSTPASGQHTTGAATNAATPKKSGAPSTGSLGCIN
jgi:LCP family protein required for cell wall assembly